MPLGYQYGPAVWINQVWKMLTIRVKTWTPVMDVLKNNNLA
jgi:hypothetical protein